MKTAQLDHIPPTPDATTLPASLQALLESKNMAWSFQRYHNVSLRLLGAMPGMTAITGTKIKEWDPKVAAELFSESSLFGYQLDNDLIRNGDTVLCAMPVASREALMDQDRQRRLKQQGQAGNPGLDALAEQLEELGLTVPEGSKKRGKQVQVHGYDSAEDAAAKGVRRKVGTKQKE